MAEAWLIGPRRLGLPAVWVEADLAASAAVSRHRDGLPAGAAGPLGARFVPLTAAFSAAGPSAFSRVVV